jgi:cell division septation protein DedD
MKRKVNFCGKNTMPIKIIFGLIIAIGIYAFFKRPRVVEGLISQTFYQDVLNVKDILDQSTMVDGVNSDNVENKIIALRNYYNVFSNKKSKFMYGINRYLSDTTISNSDKINKITTFANDIMYNPITPPPSGGNASTISTSNNPSESKPKPAPATAPATATDSKPAPAPAPAPATDSKPATV